MKIIAISFLILFILIGFSLSIDVLMGFDLRTSVHHAFSPLIVKEAIEFFVFLSLFLIVIGRAVYFHFMEKNEGQADKN
ncbi:hypothetical protein [Bacillus sp. B15-48]|uniref:hypothetical protein n=1 Tax=Bacillus sp. B15-48 TaxID=1548601 RepID=UPI00193F98E2|nr:hypothetical protein [Bacillus sp. B15-48]MBM4760981.1 hypothetical protein [Bacillus sp. B15-48]